MVFVEQQMRLCGALRNVMAVTVSYTVISLVYLAPVLISRAAALYIYSGTSHIYRNTVRPYKPLAVFLVALYANNIRSKPQI